MAIILIILGLSVLLLIRQLKAPKLRVPGPPLARLTRLWYFRHVYRGEFHLRNIELHKKYGPVVQIRPNEYSIDDPGAIKVIYGAASRFIKADWYYGSASPAFEHLNLFAIRDPQKHANLRRKLSSFYSMSYLAKYESFIDNSIAVLCARLRELAHTKKKINLAHWLQCYAFDVITGLTFGRPFGFLQSGEDVNGLIATLDRVLLYNTRAGIFPTLHYILAGLLGIDPARPIPLFGINKIEQRKKSGNPKLDANSADFLTLILDLVQKKPDVYSVDTAIAVCAMNLAAGSDTTGISLSAVFYHIAKNNTFQEKVLEELNTAFPDSEGHHRFTFKETLSLPYLQAFIKEALRLQPAVGLPLARRVPRGGANISGFHFPEGTVVGVNPWVAHRNQSVFGEDADIFQPDRWIVDDADRLASMERYFIPFGSGSRTCIGKHISLLEMSKVIPVLVKTFKFTLQDNYTNDYSTSKCDWFVKPKALPVLIEERD